jgi:hypothetical protein|eukprot:7385865-Prymnesium_polylepis.1
MAGAQLVTLEWDKNTWGVKDAPQVSNLLKTFDYVLHLDLSDTDMSFDGVELTATAIAKMDSAAKLLSLKWSNGKVMGKREELNEKIGMMECAGPYERPGLVSIMAMLESLESLEHLDLSCNYIEQPGEFSAHRQPANASVGAPEAAFTLEAS